MTKDLKQKIFTQFLENVKTQGWSLAAMQDASRLVAEDENAGEALIGGEKAFAEYYFAVKNNEMLAELAEIDPTELKIRERIKQAVIIRLRQSDKQVIKQLLKFLAHPNNADIALLQLHTTTDLIWKWAGDKSTDFNYYTKRGLLALIYSTTLLNFLQNDDSDKTYAFLDKRIEDVMKIGKYKAKLHDLIESTPLPDLLRKAIF